MSRISFGGHGDPIPLEAMPDANNDNAFTLVLPDGYVFKKEDWIALGYTNYEVMCVGAAGGMGGKSDFAMGLYASNYNIFSMGGAGGGGGLEVVSGSLEDLPDECAVVVGSAGTNGADGVYSYGAYGGSDGHGALSQGHAGTDGGPSSFGGTICRASGGKGGEAPPATNGNWADANAGIREVLIDGIGWIREVRAGGNGGQGGIGGRTTVGGGAEGGKSLPGPVGAGPGSTLPYGQTLTAEETGSWDGHIGEGGGGGRGGTYAYFIPPNILNAI